MNIFSSNPNLSVTPEVEQTLPIQSLLHLIAQQQEHTQRQEDEIRRLPEGPKRPHWKPSPLEPTGGEKPTGAGAGDYEGQPRRGPRQQKTAQLKIHATERMPLAEVPPGLLDS